MALAVYARKFWSRLIYEVDKLRFLGASDSFPAVAPVISLPHQFDSPSSDVNSPEELFNSGFLWAWHRRSVERRLSRKHGQTKMLKPKKNLLVCDVCGHYYEAHTVCGNCWNKVKQETVTMQEAIQKELELKPVEKEVVVLYKNDTREKNQEGKTIVEIPRERPPWFSKNLLVKSNS